MATVSYIIKSPKHPEAFLDYRHDFADDLLVEGEDVGDAILGFDHGDPEKHPTVTFQYGGNDATISDVVLDGSEIIYWVEGGRPDTELQILIDVWTEQGRNHIAVARLKIRKV